MRFRGVNRLLTLALAGALALTGARAGAETVLQTQLRDRIEAGLATDSLIVMGERLDARDAIRTVYPQMDYRPIWVDADGLNARGKRLLDWLRQELPKQGLRAADYHLDAVARLTTRHDTGAAVDMELALSDAFLTAGSHFASGRLDPRTLDPQWSAVRREQDLEPVLLAAAAGQDPETALQRLLPRYPAYARLVAALDKLRRLRNAGGWGLISAGPPLREGDAGDRVDQLIRRLTAAGDLTGTRPNSFDADVARAVQSFQRRHGLGADGVVGPTTLDALNVPVQTRIDQIIVNLERWRWLPESLGERYVLVNIAGFELDAVDAGNTALTMRVVVGRPYRSTPVFSAKISYLVLNPAWEVPRSIAVQDELPLIKGDPAYLAQHHFVLLKGWGAAERVVDPHGVDWNRVTQDNFPYHLRQAPGPDNALGRIKFMFPNPFSVYLHDTPARALFTKESRGFSSGCIRVEHPLALAGWLLEGDPAWRNGAIERAIREGGQQTIRLPQPTPIHILYWTAWADAQGVLNFREDIYDRDKRVLEELRKSPPK